MTPFYGWASTVLRLQNHNEETVYFLPLNPWELCRGTHLIDLGRIKD